MTSLEDFDREDEDYERLRQREDEVAAAHHAAMLEKVREELECLITVHQNGLKATAKKLAASLGLSREFQQELNAYARTARVG